MSTYYVSLSGNDGASCGAAQNPLSPKRTLAGALPCAAPGDTILLRAGVYDEALNNPVVAGTSWAVPVRIAAYPGEIVWLKPTTAPPYVLFFNGSQQYVVFDGINLDGSGCVNGTTKWESSGGHDPHHIRLMNCEAIGPATSPGVPPQIFLTDHQDTTVTCLGGHEYLNVVAHSVAGDALSHGLYAATPNTLVDGCEFYDVPGAGIQFFNGHSQPMPGGVIRNTRVHHGRSLGGVARHWGIILADYSSGVLVYNCLVDHIPYEGASSVGIFAYANFVASAGHQLLHNTVTDNAGEGLVAEVYAPNTVVENNLAYLNARGDFRDENARRRSTTASNNFLTANGNPLFVNPAAINYRLQAGSPAINFGMVLPAVTTDKDGVPRPQGAGYDAGAYERVSAAAFALSAVLRVSVTSASLKGVAAVLSTQATLRVSTTSTLVKPGAPLAGTVALRVSVTGAPLTTGIALVAVAPRLSVSVTRAVFGFTPITAAATLRLAVPLASLTTMGQHALLANPRLSFTVTSASLTTQTHAALVAAGSLRVSLSLARLTGIAAPLTGSAVWRVAVLGATLDVPVEEDDDCLASYESLPIELD